jgi:hypothetical protein
MTRPRTGYAIAKAKTTAKLKAELAAHHATEYNIHTAIVELIERSKLPGVIYWHCPNGARRTHAEAAALKAMGMLAGVADFCFSMPGGRFAFIEVKTKTGALSEEQEAFLAGMERNGNRTAVVRSIDEAAFILSSWGVIRGARVAA